MYYLKILYKLAALNLQEQLSHRSSFLFLVSGKIIRVGVYLLFIEAIFFNTPHLNGWQREESLLLVASFLVIQYLVGITYGRNLLFHLARDIRNGDYDFILTKPINKLFYSSFKIIDFLDLVSLLPVLVIWLSLLKNLAFQGLFPLFVYFILMALGFIFQYALTLIVSTITFYQPTPISLGRFFNSLIRGTARLPIDIFPNFLRWWLTFIIPLALIATLPVKFLTKGLSVFELLYFTGFTLLFLWFSTKVWYYGLKKYTSASSELI